MGAWIETVTLPDNTGTYRVAPYVGAWIETFDASGVGQAYLVAPYVGAWIETISRGHILPRTESHPTWVRGLKLTVLLFRTKLGLADPKGGAGFETLQNVWPAVTY